jgi:hypothetical protein
VERQPRDAPEHVPRPGLALLVGDQKAPRAPARVPRSACCVPAASGCSACARPLRWRSGSLRSRRPRGTSSRRPHCAGR